MRITVTTASRLHFGLLSLAACAAPPAARRFGGVGLMIDQPGLRLTLEPAAAWSAAGPLAKRALAFAQQFASSSDIALSPQRLVIEHAPPEHVGLGVGTQLGLAVAQALATVAGVEIPAIELARRVGRGQRSAIGIHGFAHGGFLVDAGKRSPDAIAPLLVRVDFPPEWPIVLILPPHAPGTHGAEELAAFAQLAADPARTDALCRLVLLGLLPALIERDLAAFSEALFDFNARAGEAFAPIQGGTYASTQVADIVAFVRAQGIQGVGQSSWGPGLFAVVGDDDRAQRLAEQLSVRFGFGSQRVVVTRGCNRGAAVSVA